MTLELNKQCISSATLVLGNNIKYFFVVYMSNIVCSKDNRSLQCSHCGVNYCESAPVDRSIKKNQCIILHFFLLYVLKWLWKQQTSEYRYILYIWLFILIFKIYVHYCVATIRANEKQESNGVSMHPAMCPKPTICTSRQRQDHYIIVGACVESKIYGMNIQ